MASRRSAGQTAWRVLAGLMFILLAAGRAGAGSGGAGGSAVLAFPDAPRAGGWEMLRVTVAGGTEVSVQDARGGPVFCREVAAGAGERTVLMPLPLMAGEHLPADEWPVRIGVRNGAGAWESSVVSVVRPGGAAGLRRGFRVVTAVREGLGEQEKALGELGGAPAAVLHVSAEEYLHDPALVFAAADALWVDEKMAGQVTSERAASLMNAGAELIAGGDTAPGGALGGWLWVRPAHDDGPRFWLAPAEHGSLAPPRVVWPGMRDFPGPGVTVSPALRLTGWLVTPVAIGVVLLGWAFFQRRGILLMAVAVGLSAATAGMVWVMRSEAGEMHMRLGWTVRHAPGGAEQSEVFESRGALRGEMIVLESREPTLPVAQSAEGWLSMSGVNVELRAEGCKLSAELASRSVMVFHTATLGRAKPMDATFPPARDGWIVEEGYVRGSGSFAKEAVLFTQWIRSQPPAAQRVLAAWAAMSQETSCRYALHVPPEESAEVMTVIDYGPAAPVTPTAPASASRPALDTGGS